MRVLSHPRNASSPRIPVERAPPRGEHRASDRLASCRSLPALVRFQSPSSARSASAGRQWARPRPRWRSASSICCAVRVRWSRHDIEKVVAATDRDRTGRHGIRVDQSFVERPRRGTQPDALHHPQRAPSGTSPSARRSSTSRGGGGRGTDPLLVLEAPQRRQLPDLPGVGGGQLNAGAEPGTATADGTRGRDSIPDRRRRTGRSSRCSWSGIRGASGQRRAGASGRTNSSKYAVEYGVMPRATRTSSAAATSAPVTR